MKNLGWLLLLCALNLPAQRFYADDPLEFEPAPRTTGDVQRRKLSDYFDLLSHQFSSVGQRQPVDGPPLRAQAVNTLGEPYQGAWWVKRHYYQRMSLEQLRSGAGPTTVPAAGPWKVLSIKNEGITPGFRILDSQNHMFFVKFDPVTNPEMATAADAITSRLFHAMGYHVPENNVVYFTPGQLEVADDPAAPGGEAGKMKHRTITEVLLKVPRSPDGTYRATASLALPGITKGPPRYYGTRADDPNDVVPHEHRRDQRGLHVIDAWVSHDDSRAINNEDSLVEENGRTFLRHYQLDFGSTLGSATQKPNSPRSGAYFFSWKESAKQLFTLGLVPQYWANAEYPDYPSIGRFEWQVFDPERWVPEYPNPAFLNRLPDDEFWGAKLVTAFTDAEIRAIVETGRLSDKEAEAWLIRCLIERRDKIGRVYFAKLLPLDRFDVRNGTLTWDDVGARLRYTPPADVTLAWESFDNATGSRSRIANANTAAVPAQTSGYSLATLTSTTQPSHRIEVFLRHTSAGPQVIGVERSW